MRRVDLRELLETSVDATQAMFAEKEVRLAASLPTTQVAPQGDSTRLVQVFANLLSNAAKYSDRGGSVRLDVRVDAPFRAQVRVVDDGIGIPPARLGTRFEMFTQLDVDPARSQGGLGIGLAISKRLVELHGGRIVVASDGEGRGSVFTVELPLAPASDTAVVATVAPTTRRTLRILIVDDNVEGAEMLGMLLETSGHQIAYAANGRDGIAAASTFAPEAILLDLGLPDIEGYEVARQLRAAALTPRPAIVAVTGWGDASHRQRTRDAGFDDHLVKPVDRSRLFELLGNLVTA